MSHMFYPAWTVRWREGKYSVNLVCRTEIHVCVVCAVLICVAFKKKKKSHYLQSSPTALHNGLKLWWCGLAHIHSTTNCLAVWSENLEYLGEIVLLKRDWLILLLLLYMKWKCDVKLLHCIFKFFNRLKCQAVCWPSLFIITWESVALCVWRCLAVVLWITTAFYII